MTNYKYKYLKYKLKYLNIKGGANRRIEYTVKNPVTGKEKSKDVTVNIVDDANVGISLWYISNNNLIALDEEFQRRYSPHTKLEDIFPDNTTVYYDSRQYGEQAKPIDKFLTLLEIIQEYKPKPYTEGVQFDDWSSITLWQQDDDKSRYNLVFKNIIFEDQICSDRNLQGCGK